MKALMLVLTAFRDLFFRWLPGRLVQSIMGSYQFAFIVHPGDLEDVCRKYPFASRYPRGVVDWALSHFWPVICDRIHGFVVDGKELKGLLITIPLTPKLMRRNGGKAETMVIRAVKLAKKFGVANVGLGGLNCWITHDGESVVRVVPGISVTTGHAYTVGIVLEYIYEVLAHKQWKMQDIMVAIVGAGGLMGQPLRRILAQGTYGKGCPKELILVDVAQKRDSLQEFARFHSSNEANGFQITVRSLEEALPLADIVIVVTNSDEVIIKDAALLKNGAVIIDDTFPRNVSLSVIKERGDVTCLHVGVYAPQIKINFSLPLKPPQQYTCLVGTMVLAAKGWNEGNYDVGGVSEERMNQIVEWGKDYHFGIGLLLDSGGGRVDLQRVSSGRYKALDKGK